MKTTTITRKQLYDQVWSEPMRRLAARYGLSDVGLAKICRKYDIPRPPRGYWAMKEHGKAPSQTPLPRPTDTAAITLRDPETCRLSSLDLQETVEKKAAAEETCEARIEVAESLHGSHALVRQANQELQAAETDEDRLIVLPETPSLSVSVSKASLRRALLIMDALLKGLEQRDYEVAAGPSARILDISVHFSITEELDIQREQPAEHELDGYYEFGHSRFQTKRVPSGRLVLHLDGADADSAGGCQRSWRDAKKQRIEDCLNKFVAGMVRFAARKKQYEEERERRAQKLREEEQHRKEEADHRAEKRRLMLAEQARVTSLMQDAQTWMTSQTLRRYIEAKRQRYLVEHGRIEPNDDFAHWLAWAIQQADRLDPIAESPPSILDEPIPEEPKPRNWWERG